LPVKPYFIVAANEIRLNFAWYLYNIAHAQARDGFKAVHKVPLKDGS
jgi:hypothetical protein